MEAATTAQKGGTVRITGQVVSDVSTCKTLPSSDHCKLHIQNRLPGFFHARCFLFQHLKVCAAIINIFHLIPAASQKMIEPLTTLTLKGERDLLVEAGSPFREPLIKFLLRYPQPTVDLFLSDGKIKDQQWNRCFEVHS